MCVYLLRGCGLCRRRKDKDASRPHAVTVTTLTLPTTANHLQPPPLLCHDSDIFYKNARIYLSSLTFTHFRPPGQVSHLVWIAFWPLASARPKWACTMALFLVRTHTKEFHLPFVHCAAIVALATPLRGLRGIFDVVKNPNLAVRRRRFNRRRRMSSYQRQSS